ncbi:Conserved TM helix [Micromonospora matsumotoense]|uniref:Conserved TM helix n=1 Tax=Micromonospora matsumotoense TaxID=121616 RepID=A0A1C4VTF4_9ACTN|nr:Conserved TM helix [Micromonospora matsumotoense]
MTDNFGDAAGDALRAVLLFLPKAVAFAAILVAGWLIAKAVRKIVDRVLDRVHFDRAVERGGIKTALARSRYDASDIVAKLAYYGVLLVTLQLAFGIWGPNPISDLIAGVIAWLPRAFVAIVIVVVAAAIANAVKDIISSALGGLSYGRVLANIASVFILGLGVIAALNQIGVATAVTTPVLIAVLATVGGILVVGVGGGLIRPMQARWESWLTRAEQESRTIATHARAYQAGRRDVEARLSPYAEAERTPSVPTVVAPTPPTPRDDDAERTQVVTRPDDVEATQVVPRPDEAEQTQVVSRPADGEPTPPVTPGPHATDASGVPVPRQAGPVDGSTTDSEATMVIPPLDPGMPRR